MDETPRARTFHMESPCGPAWDFLPGQFVQLRLPEDPKTIRAYSLTSSPLEPGRLEITLEKAGPFTERLFELKPGNDLQVRGPFGKFIYRESAAHAVLLAGGSGVTPFRSFVRYVRDKGLPNRLTLVYSIYTPSDIIFRKEFEELCRTNHNFKVFYTVTRPQTMAPGETWNGPTGRITLPYLKGLISDFDGAAYYICGSTRFIHDVAHLLRGAGILDHQIIYEKWGDF